MLKKDMIASNSPCTHGTAPNPSFMVIAWVIATLKDLKSLYLVGNCSISEQVDAVEKVSQFQKMSIRVTCWIPEVVGGQHQTRTSVFPPSNNSHFYLKITRCKLHNYMYMCRLRAKFTYLHTNPKSQRKRCMLALPSPLHWRLPWSNTQKTFIHLAYKEMRSAYNVIRACLFINKAGSQVGIVLNEPTLTKKC